MLKKVAAMAALAQLGLAATGKPGDFDFLSGNWRIQNRRIKGAEWDVFDSEASVHGILAGVARVEELRKSGRKGCWHDFVQMPRGLPRGSHSFASLISIQFPSGS